jgi:hypothetical protein
VSKAEIEAGVSVLKDVNFVTSGCTVRLGSKLGPAFEEQLRRDVKWLKDNKIMDYSLLLGVGRHEDWCENERNFLAQDELKTNQCCYNTDIYPCNQLLRSRWQQESGGIMARRNDDSKDPCIVYFFSIVRYVAL